MYKKTKLLIKSKLNYLQHNISNYFDKGNKYVVLLYHRVINNEIDDLVDNYILTDEFYHQIKFLNLNYDILKFDDVENYKNLNNIGIIITFDDGYVDNYLNAYPILKSHNNSAIFFVLPNYVNNNRPIWDREICILYKYYLENRNKPQFNNILLDESLNINKFFNIWQLIRFLKNKNISYIEDVIQNLKNQLEYKYSYNDEDLCMKWSQLKELAKNNMTIGSHGLNHLSLGQLSIESANTELLISKEKIEKNLNINCEYFAFPFGNKIDYNNQNLNYLTKIGYKNCFLNHGGYNKPSHFKLMQNRIISNRNKNLNYILN